LPYERETEIRLGHKLDFEKISSEMEGVILSDMNRDQRHNPAKTKNESEDSERRLGIERRRFSYSNHVPEKRTGSDRRKPDQE